MNPPSYLDAELGKLWESLVRLHHAMREQTRITYNRMNPFGEDIFDWKERGAFWTDSDKNITIYNSTTLAGDVDIGDNTWVGPFCSLDGTGGLSIGKFCSITAGCQLLSHDTVKWALSGGREQFEHSRTEIGDCCFLGTHAVVLKGVKIGSRCVVAAGSVVTKSVKEDSIVAGVPARQVGTVDIDKDGRVILK
jgi:acetyltransferase-like isoleucine patch superfamily enzyme